MKTNIATFALFLAGISAVAVPEQADWQTHSASEVKAESGPVLDLQVTSDFFPGVTFSGTAETIYYKMKALNPASVSDLISVEEDTSLAKRAASFNCGWGANAKWSSCVQGMNYLRGLGKAWCRVGPGYGTRSRVSCNNGCGIYLSNKLSSDLSVFCEDIANDVADIGARCQLSPTLVNIHGAKDFDSHFIGIGGDNC